MQGFSALNTEIAPFPVCITFIYKVFPVQRREYDCGQFLHNVLIASNFHTFFVQTVGMPYLSDTLKPVIDKIFEERKYCELDPSKNAERKQSALR